MWSQTGDRGAIPPSPRVCFHPRGGDQFVPSNGRAVAVTSCLSGLPRTVTHESVFLNTT